MSCPPNCGHTEREHEAFDRGVRDGRNDLNDCPFDDAELITVWLIGHSVGELDREAEEATASA